MVMKMGRPKADNAKTKSVTIRLPDVTHKELSKYAAEHKMTMTEVIIRSLDDFLSKEKGAL